MNIARHIDSLIHSRGVCDIHILVSGWQSILDVYFQKYISWWGITLSLTSFICLIVTSTCFHLQSNYSVSKHIHKYRKWPSGNKLVPGGISNAYFNTC